MGVDAKVSIGRYPIPDTGIGLTLPAIELPFGLRTWVGLANHVLDGVQIPPWEGANF